jgi:hypothetical protein
MSIYGKVRPQFRFDGSGRQITVSDAQAPIARPTTLYVLMAFERAEDGELRPAFEAQQMPGEHAAVARAKLMSRSYAGVIAWSRPARPDEGEFGEPVVLFQHGEVPEME